MLAFWHPGEPIWDLGDILGDCGSSRKDMPGSGVEIGSISGPFANAILKVCWTPMANILFFPSGSFLITFCIKMHVEIGMPGALEIRFSNGKNCKNEHFRRSGFWRY